MRQAGLMSACHPRLRFLNPTPTSRDRATGRIRHCIVTAAIGGAPVSEVTERYGVTRQTVPALQNGNEWSAAWLIKHLVEDRLGIQGRRDHSPVPAPNRPSSLRTRWFGRNHPPVEFRIAPTGSAYMSETWCDYGSKLRCLRQSSCHSTCLL